MLFHAGSSAPDKSLVCTKLGHFSETTSHQTTALSHGKQLPLTLDSSPPTPPTPLSPPSLPSPLTLSMSLNQIQSDSYPNQSTCSSTLGSSTCSSPPPLYHFIGNTASFIPSQQLSVKMHKQVKGGCPLKNKKTKPMALRHFVMKKCASSPSSLMQGDEMDVQPPPAKKAPESDSSANDGGAGGPGDSCKSVNYSGTEGESSSDSPNGFWDMQTEDVGDSGSNLANGGQGNPQQLALLDEEDQYSVASWTTFDTTMTDHSSLTSSGKGKTQTSIISMAGGTNPGPSAPASRRRGRPPKTSYSNRGNLTSELKSLTSKSKSSINFDKVFSYYPPKLVVRDGELQPERSLSVKGLKCSALSRLPEGHPFLSWNLGQPVNASSTFRGARRRKRKPPEQ